MGDAESTQRETRTTRELPAADARWFAAQLPPPDELRKMLGADPVEALIGIARGRAPIDPSLAIDSSRAAVPGDPTSNPEVRQHLALALEAIAKLEPTLKDPKKVNSVEISEEERKALHALVHLAARPAIPVKHGGLPPAPPPWPQLNEKREGIARRIAGIGRLDLHDRTPIGTGWFAAPRFLMTNKHVVAGLCNIPVHGNDDWRKQVGPEADTYNRIWQEQPERRPVWDPGDSPASDKVPAGRILRVFRMHAAFDMALLEVEGVTDSHNLVLPLSSVAPTEEDGELVYVAGYPSVGSHYDLHPALLDLLFGPDRDTVRKRVAPGRLRGPQQLGSRTTHDASTLRGNSGSAVLRFDTHEVAALHFGGEYGSRNFAVPLWKLRADPFFDGVDVHFG